MPGKSLEVMYEWELYNDIGEEEGDRFLSLISNADVSSQTSSLIHQRTMTMDTRTYPFRTLLTGSCFTGIVASYLVNPILGTLVAGVLAFPFAVGFLDNLHIRYMISLEKFSKNIGLSYDFIVELPLDSYVNINNTSKEYYSSRRAKLFGAQMSDGSMVQILVYKKFFKVNLTAHFFKLNLRNHSLKVWDSAFWYTFQILPYMETVDPEECIRRSKNQTEASGTIPIPRYECDSAPIQAIFP